MNFRTWVASLAPTEGTVRVSGQEIAEIVLDHPPTRNALSPAMMVGLADAIEVARGARVVILRGAGGYFCSGGNLQMVRDQLVRPGGGAELVAFMQATTETLAALDAVVIGAVEGAALGGGAELLTACDFVVAAPDARIGFVQAHLGVSTGFGGGTRLVARVGAAGALSLLTRGVVDAAEAHEMGVVDAVDADPSAWARSTAEALCVLPAAALVGAKRVVRAATTLPSERALEEEREVFAALWGGPEHLAALANSVRPR